LFIMVCGGNGSANEGAQNNTRTQKINEKIFI